MGIPRRPASRIVARGTPADAAQGLASLTDHHLAPRSNRHRRLGYAGRSMQARFSRLLHGVATARAASCAVAAAAALSAVVAASVGCSATTPERAQRHSGPVGSGPIRFVGRVEPGPGAEARYAWSGAGFVARFSGTGVAVRLSDEKNQHQVVLDGRPLRTLVTTSGVERYLVAEGLPPGEHRLELYRRTEALFGVTRFLGIEVVDGHLVDAGKAPTRHIELVGDSISCGYGNEGGTPDCQFSPDTENHYLSYGAVLARSLSAEISTVAWSGRGVVKNYDGGPGDHMGRLYERTLPESSSSRWSQRESNDAVIVNLGTNDYSTEPDPEERLFVREYVTLLELIRHNNPHAFILCTVGPMLDGLDLERAEAGIATAVRQRRSAGDSRVSAHRMTTRNESPGCDWHPGIATHRRMAEELAVPIKAALGW
jgi:lysophospholipase L1-like esterase